MKIRKKYLYLFFLIIIHIILSLIFMWPAPQILSDSAFHTNVIEETIKTGELQGTAPKLLGWFGYPRFQPFYIVYPPFGYVFWSIMYTLVGVNVVFYTSILLYLLSIVLLFLFLRRMFNEKIALLSATGFALFYFFLSSITHTPMIIFFLFALLLILSITIFVDKKLKNREYILIAIFLSIIFMVKQSAYAIVIAAFILIAYLCYKKKNWNMLIIIIIFIILSTPILIYQINKTGTISPLTLRGVPILDSIFHPKFLEIQQWQLDLDNESNLYQLEQIVSETYYTVYPPIYNGINPTINLIDIFNNNFFTPNAKQLYPKLEIIAFFSLMGMILFFLKYENEHFKFFMMMLIIITFSNMLLNPKVEYLIFLPALTIFTIFYYAQKYLNKYALVLTMFVLMVLLINSSYTYQKYNQEFYNKTIMRQGVPGGYNTLIDYTTWIQTNTNTNAVIMDANTPDVPWYSNRTTFWDYRLVHLNETRLLYYLKNHYTIDYIVIRDTQITNTPNNFDSIPKNSSFLKIINEKKYFKEEYSKNGVHIYKNVINENETAS